MNLLGAKGFSWILSILCSQPGGPGAFQHLLNPWPLLHGEELVISLVDLSRNAP